MEIVKADFVMFEVHGMHNYRYLQTAKKCVSQPQDWNSMLANQINPDPNTAWTRHVIQNCEKKSLLTSEVFFYMSDIYCFLFSRITDAATIIMGHL